MYNDITVFIIWTVNDFKIVFHGLDSVNHGQFNLDLNLEQAGFHCVQAKIYSVQLCSAILFLAESKNSSLVQ